MRVQVLTLFSLAIAVTVLAQHAGDNVTQVLTFSSADTPQAMQEIAYAIRSVAQLPQTSLQTASRSLTVQATPASGAIANWLFQQLDAPQAAPPQVSQIDTYSALTEASDQLRIFRLAHPAGAQAFQGLANAIRVVPDMSQVFPCFSKMAIAVRGTADQLAVAEWLFKELDQRSPAWADARGTTIPFGPQPVT
jgi:hypothetical protein